MIEANGVKLRAVELSDVDLLYEWENDQSLFAVGNPTSPYSKYQLKKFVESSSGDLYEDRQLRLIIEAQIDLQWRVVGIIDAFEFDPFHLRAGIGILIHKNFQQKGYASEALKIFSRFLFSKWNLHQLYATIEITNSASRLLFVSNDFKEIGVRREWLKTAKGYLDAVDYQLIAEQ
ncbi:MAG: GNAT family N-acetyltransferase [Breznakibacter sp.]|jgi:diamine N-acetyltransferase|nr:GNAT family N-acetyltransferase [Breznakibacter sp.]